MRKFFLILLLAPLLYAGEAKATHIIGGELTYECLDPTNHIYRITMKLYRDCTPGVPHAGFDSVVYVGVYYDDSVRHPLLPIGADMPFPQNYITLDNETYDVCLFAPPNVCVEEAIYTKIVTLTQRPGGYILLYQRCCRNASIVNIAGPLGTGAHWSVQIPGTGTTCNSSPAYNLYPPTIICANKNIDFDHSATDADGDSLVYRLCRAYDGAFGVGNAAPPPPAKHPAFGSVDYITPTYDWFNPLGGADTLKIDPATGQLSGIAHTIGQFVVAICVDEYRGGQFLSSNRRDFQFNVVTCDSIVYPSFTANIEPCASDYSVEFEYTGKNGSEWLWDFGDAGSSDDTASGDRPVYTFSDTGTYLVTLTVNPGQSCDSTITGWVTVPEWRLSADFSFNAVCEGQPVNFTDQSITNQGLVITDWNWDFGDGAASTAQNPTHTYFDGTPRTVTLVITTDDGCTDSISYPITFEPLPLVTASADVEIQLGDDATLSAIGGGGTPPYTFSWSPATSPSTGTPVSASPTTTTTYTVTITDNLGCKNTDDVRVLLLSDIAVEVPTAFTPNGDGLNDFFLVYDKLGTATQSIAELEFNIYNRWGEMVYQATSVDEALNGGWDGTHMKNSKEMEIGVYVWLLKVTKLDGEELEPQYGNVSLLR